MAFYKFSKLSISTKIVYLGLKAAHINIKETIINTHTHTHISSNNNRKFFAFNVFINNVTIIVSKAFTVCYKMTSLLVTEVCSVRDSSSHCLHEFH